jgi:AcrR family transcriptional regulator
VPPRTKPAPGLRREPTQARSKERVARILDVTAALVDDGGLDAVTTNAIAEAAGLPVGTIYQFFPNREAVLHALLARQLDALDAKFEPFLAPGADELPIDRAVDGVVTALAEAYLALPALAALVQGLRRDPSVGGAIELNNRRVAGWVADLARRRLPALSPARAKVIATAVVEAGDAVLQAWLRVARAEGRAKAKPYLDELRALLIAYLSSVLARTI